jgi:hypothetical protein
MRNFDSRLTQSRNTNLVETAAPGCPAEQSSAEAADKPDISKICLQSRDQQRLRTSTRFVSGYGLAISQRARPNSASQFAEKLRFSTSVPEGVVEKTPFTARLKASPDTNRDFFRSLWEPCPSQPVKAYPDTHRDWFGMFLLSAGLVGQRERGFVVLGGDCIQIQLLLPAEHGYAATIGFQMRLGFFEGLLSFT